MKYESYLLPLCAIKKTSLLMFEFGTILTWVIICPFITRAHSDTVIFFMDQSVSLSIQRVLHALKVVKNVSPRFDFCLLLYFYEAFMIAYYLFVTVSAI